MGFPRKTIIVPSLFRIQLMKQATLSLLAMLLASAVYAQTGGTLQAGQRQSGFVSIQSTYQSFTVDEVNIAEFSAPLTVFVPLGTRAGMALTAAGASVSGDTVSTLSGLSDTQLHLSYNQRLGRASLVASLRFNVPNGAKELSRAEFATLTQLSLNQYDFRLPGFGAGMGVSPGITLALPVSERAAVGIGAAFQYRGGYMPIKNLIDSYKPGNEVLLTAGFNVRISQPLNWSVDATYTAYESDRLGDQAFFSPGNKMVLTSRLSFTQGYNQAWIQALVRNREPNSLINPDGLEIEEEFRTLPDQKKVAAGYTMRMASRSYLSLVADARFFGDASILPDVSTVYSGGLTLDIAVSRAVAIPLQGRIFAGDLTGYEFGFGIRTQF